MRKVFLRTAAALALALPAVAKADSPNLSGFTTIGTQFFALGGQTFNIQFLFGRQALSSTLFYQTDGVDGGNWVKILATTGAYPGATATPTPGTMFGSFTVNGPVNSLQTVRFALCNSPNGASPSTVSQCTAPGPFYSTTNSTPSTNVRALTSTQWNALNPVAEGGAIATLNTVFGFEDQVLADSDRDYNDVVFATNLSTVVPEPSTYALMAAGLLGLVAVRRRRQNA